MKEYREARRRGESREEKYLSTFSPLKPLKKEEIEELIEFTDAILHFTYRYCRNL